ncbi:hypothetical protein Tco_0126551 [Tanacetum coccineum]
MPSSAFLLPSLPYPPPPLLPTTVVAAAHHHHLPWSSMAEIGTFFMKIVNSSHSYATSGSEEHSLASSVNQKVMSVVSRDPHLRVTTAISSKKLRASQEGLEVRMTDDDIMDKVLGTSRRFTPGWGKKLPNSASSSSLCSYPALTIGIPSCINEVFMDDANDEGDAHEDVADPEDE